MSTDTPFVDTGRRVIAIEMQALSQLHDALDDNFARAVDQLLKSTGRVIVTGIGKSGHIAHKIAATLASTGTPAQFVHPAEASHGDLGMVTSHDAVIAISNSGEAPELADLIAYTRRFAIPLIGITSRPESALGKQCDIIVTLPRAEAGVRRHRHGRRADRDQPEELWRGRRDRRQRCAGRYHHRR